MQQDPIAQVDQEFASYGDIYYAPLLGQDIYFIRHPAEVHDVLITQAAKLEKPREGIAADQLRRLLGDGLLTSTGELWRRQRRLIQPAFRKERLEEYTSLFVGHAKSMLDGWSDHSQVDISQAMMELTLRIVSKALFDHDIGGESDRVAAAMRVLRGAFGSVDAVLPGWLVTPSRLRTLSALGLIDDVVYGLMDRPRGEQRRDLLSALLRSRAEPRASTAASVHASLDPSAERGMSRRQLRDELLTLFVAGHETTAHALSWTLHLLATHPDIARRLEREMDAVLGQRAPGLSDLFKLPYLEQIFCESLRMFPPAYALARVAVEELQLGGYAIPRGATVVLWIYHLHHDARWYPEPEQFDPERFAPGRRTELPPSAFVPFGAGTRSCIGKQFAMLEAQLILLCILQRFRLAPTSPSVARDTAMTLAPKGGLRLIVHERPSTASGAGSGLWPALHTSTSQAPDSAEGSGS